MKSTLGLGLWGDLLTAKRIQESIWGTCGGTAATYISKHNLSYAKQQVMCDSFCRELFDLLRTFFGQRDWCAMEDGTGESTGLQRGGYICGRAER